MYALLGSGLKVLKRKTEQLQVQHCYPTDNETPLQQFLLCLGDRSKPNLVKSAKVSMDRQDLLFRLPNYKAYT